jgi:hypothetical protein
MSSVNDTGCQTLNLANCPFTPTFYSEGRQCLYGKVRHLLTRPRMNHTTLHVLTHNCFLSLSLYYYYYYFYSYV